MEDEGLTDELCALVVVAEDIRDGRRAEPFSPGEIYRLCNEMRRAIALLSTKDADFRATDDERDL